MRLAGEGPELWSGQRLIMISRADEHRPLARFGATVAIAENGTAVLVIGGIEGHIIGGVCLNEIWRFDVDLACWEKLPTPSWSPRRGAVPVVIEGQLLLVGGTGLDARPLREVWAAECDRWRPTTWKSITANAPWADASHALWVPRFDGSEFGGLLLIDSLGALWCSRDKGKTWTILLDQLPFGRGAEQVAAMRYCCNFLVVVTMSTKVWISKDAAEWISADGGRDPHGLVLGDAGALEGPPGLRCQVTDVVSSDSSHMLVVARHRDTCQLTLWQLSITRQDDRDRDRDRHAFWRCLVPRIQIYPGFSSVNQLVAAARAELETPNGREMRAVFVEFNPINEFTIWRASPAAVDQHRAMLDRLGASQSKVDHCTWQLHIMGALLPQMGADWVPRGPTKPPPTKMVWQDDIWTYWH
ncbi:unnamed protein product [Effrenium voratum]|uniref:Uncharacterized protein n=1 Tax=Effrenium voratum TaxID=2562239 RepID=A0AA36J3M9_9DINO|nr:unnamed protein product [Effrenium voratum]